MGYPQPLRNAGRYFGCHRVVRDFRAFKEPKTFVVEWTPFYAIDFEHGGMRSQATPDGRIGIVLGPVQQCREASPIRLVLKGWSQRLCARHNKAVEACVPKAVDIGIAPVDAKVAF